MYLKGCGKMSAFLTVNGVEFPAPKRGFQFIVSTNVNAGRNANGEVIGQLVGRNIYKLNQMEWPYLDADTWHKMLQAVKGFYVPVTFEHPETGETTTITMYPGDRSAEPYQIDKYTKKTLYYANCKFNLIDCGVIGECK